MININTLVQDLGFFYPEIILTATFLAVLLADIFPFSNKDKIIPFISLAGLLLSIYFSFQLIEVQDRFLFGKMMIVDHLSVFFRIFFAFSSLIIVLLSMPTFKRSGEYYALILMTTLGMYFMASSTHIVMIVISLEIVGVSSYVLAGFRRSEQRSSEASLKFMLYGAVSTGVMLYGFSFLYGITGSANLYGIREYLLQFPVNDLMVFMSMLFILAGIGYKITMVPFHFWCPDVYEGAPTPVTAFFSVGPKVAGIALLIRFLYAGLSEQLSGVTNTWVPVIGVDIALLLAILSAVTMTLGNLAALGQTNIKRLLAYSSIAHAGYILMGFTIFSSEGVYAVLFYVVTYLFMNFGAFIVVDAIALRLKSEDIEKYRGLGTRAPFMAFSLTIFLIALTGLPPTAGFVGKLLIFASVIDKQLYWLAVVGVLNTAVSLYYYFRIPKAMYFKEVSKDDDSTLVVSRMHTVLVAVMLFLTLYFGLFWEPLRDWTTFGINFMLSAH